MDKNKEVFENMPVWKALSTLAIPTVIGQLVVLIYNLADTYYIGRTGNPYMVAAASLVLPVYNISIAVSNLMGTGGGTLVSRLLGAHREDEARKVSAFGIYLSVLLAAFYSLVCFLFMQPLLKLLGASSETLSYAAQYAFYVIVIGGIPTVFSLTMSSYFRSVGCAKQAGFGVSLGGILNIGLDPLFMFILLPKGYEVMGAAIATMLSNVIASGYYILALGRLKKKTVLTLSPHLGFPERKSVAEIFSVGIPAALVTFLYDFTNIIIDRLSSGHGDISVAAIGIVLKAERLPLNVGVGICQGMMPLAAYSFSEGNIKRMREVLHSARYAGLAFSFFCIALYQLFAGNIMKLFIDNAETVSLGTHFIRARCLSTPSMFLCFNFVFFFQAVGMGKRSLALAVIRQLLFNVPILFLMNYLFGMDGIIWTQLIADSCTAAVSFLVYEKAEKKVLRPMEKSIAREMAK